MDDDLSLLTKPVEVKGDTIPNSLAIHPMEGCDGNFDGSPGDLTRRRYIRYGAGGGGLIWFEAIAVCPEGRANPRQLWLHPKNRKQFKSMLQETREAAQDSMGSEHRPILIAQLTHSGRYSRPHGHPEPYIPQHDPYRDPMRPEPYPTSNRDSNLGNEYQIVTDEYLDELQARFVEGARLAIEVGFDGVDLKACHGYLVDELLKSRNREGRYGGSFENRSRFLIEITRKIRKDMGNDCLITSRLGYYDAVPHPYGWGIDEADYNTPDLREPKRLTAMLMDEDMQLINFTAANPYYNPHVGRPFGKPVKGGYAEPEHPLQGVERLIDMAGEIQMEFPALRLVGTGYSYLGECMGYVAAGTKRAGKATLIGGGRMAFAYPDFPKDMIEKGKLNPKKVCLACSACTQLMRCGQPTGCVIRDREVYLPLYRECMRKTKPEN